MTWQARARQAWTIAQFELRRVFFSKRSFWVYLLALFPSLIFIGHGIDVKFKQQRYASRVADAAALDSLSMGMRQEAVLQRAGQPIVNETIRRQRRRQDGPDQSHMMYFDGRRRIDLRFEDGVLTSKRSRSIANFDEDRQVFAGVFQYFYVRLAIFFGCLGIFMNLFRGEMLDKTLHFWFLVPARREVLLAGKYLAGLIAATVIFSTGALLCFGAMLWPQDPAQVQAYWQNIGLSHLFWYIASAMLACVGYGSVFLAAGLLLRNPIVPAAVILMWESINSALPVMLQKLSVLYYVQALAPVPAPTDPGMPALIKLLLSPAEPPSAAAAVAGLLAVTALVLLAASRAVRRLEINYGTD